MIPREHPTPAEEGLAPPCPDVSRERHPGRIDRERPRGWIVLPGAPYDYIPRDTALQRAEDGHPDA